MSGVIDLSHPVKLDHPLNKGLVLCCDMLPYSYNQKRIRDQFNRNNMAVGSGCTLSMIGPGERSVRFSNSSLTVPSTVFARINGKGKVTIGLWICPASFGTYRSVYDTASRHASFFMNSATDLYIGWGGSAIGASSSVAFVANEWQYLMVTYDNFNVKVYRNGKQVASTALGFTVFTEDLLFGTNPSGGGSNYQGLQSSWRVWARTLNANDAMAMYRQAKLNFRDLRNYIPTVADTDASPAVFTLTADPGIFGLTGENVDLTFIPANTYTLTAGTGVFGLTGEPVNLDYTPATQYVLTADVGIFGLQGKSVNLEYSAIGVADPSHQLFIGRFRRGQKLSITMIPSQLTDECPVVDFWLEGTTKVKTVKLPLTNKNTPCFSVDVFLNALFEDGHYVATIRYDITGTQSQHYQYFQVTGGEAEGCVVGVHEIRRPLGRAVIMHRDDGNVAMAYKPRVE